MPLIDIATEPNGLENAKLLYGMADGTNSRIDGLCPSGVLDGLGWMGDGAPPAQQPANLTDGQKAFMVYDQALLQTLPLLAKKPSRRAQAEAAGTIEPRGGGDGSAGGQTDWTTYGLIALGVLALGGGFAFLTKK